MSVQVKYQYYQLNDKDLQNSINISDNDKLLLYNRDIYSDSLYGPISKPIIAEYWEKFRWWLLSILIIIPFILYPIEILKKAWITSLFGLLACCLPSGGAPIAGGIVFMPCLQILGLSPKQAVAFCSATQMFGCGVFTPMNWYAKDPGIFIKSTFLICLPAGILGLLIALFYLPLEENAVGHCFAIFCLFLAFSTIYGLYHDLTTQNQPVTFEFPKDWKSIKPLLLYFFASMLGGLIAGWIGIGIEKIYFLLTTFYHKAELKRATISAISIIGWLSVVSASIHFFVFEDVPLPYWICCLPGVLIGSIIGPKINSYLGSTNVMLIFCSFLFLNVFYEFLK